MSDRSIDHGRDVRDTVVKSGLTGVAATVLAVTIFSPAGLGGMIGTSVASGYGGDTSATEANDPYALLPSFPSPLTRDEISDIQGQLARSSASLEITRAATEAKIDHIRSIAISNGVVTYRPLEQSAEMGAGLRLRTSVPTVGATAVVSEAPAPAPVQVSATAISYMSNDALAYRDPHLELADLLLSRETF